jgi:large subunit ribosomal protein L9
MKVILRKDVAKLGNIGDIINVKTGYARNYLIPRNLAYYATDAALKKLEIEKKLYAKVMEQEKTNAEELSAKLAEIQLSIPMKVGEEGKLYGSVTQQMITDELAVHNIKIDKRHILIDEPIKSLGVFDIKVKLHSDVTANLKVWVVSEE